MKGKLTTSGLWLSFWSLAALVAAAPRLAAVPIAGDGRPVIIQKVLPADCRAVRGFLGTPVDGSTHSWDYRGTVREYPHTASDGVAYSFNHNDGLHITLRDAAGFDAVVVRGRARARLYAGSDALVEPAGRKPVWTFRGGRPAQVAWFGRRVAARRASFFGVEGGTLAEVSFYRVLRGEPRDGQVEVWGVASDASGRPRAASLPAPPSEFAAGSLYRAMRERYGEGDRQTLALARGVHGGSPIRLARGRWLHFITPPLGTEQALAAVELDAQLSGAAGPVELTVAVQDPLDPRLDVTWIPLHIERAGPLRLILDIPDQVLLEGSRLWLSLRSDKPLRLAGRTSPAAAFRLHFIPRSHALGEAIAWRKLLLRSFFSLMSEPRPWGSYGRGSAERFFATSRYARQCPELFLTIDQCHRLAPADKLVRQYREWVYLRHLPRLSDVPPPAPPPQGVPAWAWYARSAWLEVRRIAAWWVENRMVETGEFGGRVGDDTDMYQQYADLPFFEDGGVAGRIKEGAARLAELADRQNLRGGINLRSTDALHAYEEGINHLALMARWFYGHPVYLERCMDSARNMEKLTVLTPDGRRHFRNKERMGYRDVEHPSAPAVDGGAAPLMWHAALQLADYNRNPQALRLLREWADTWLRFQKPGRWATDVEVTSGRVVGFQKHRPLYGGYRTQACTFVWLYALTGDSRYLEPFYYYLRRGQAPYPADRFLGDLYTLGALDDLPAATLERLANQNPALALYVTGDPGPLVQATIGRPRPSRAAIASLYDAQRWPDMYTVTHQFTDRVFPDLLQYASISYLGGFTRRNKFNPTLAVSWEGLGTDYAALVLVNRSDRLKLLAYNFADSPLRGSMRVWALQHGLYRVTAGPDGDGDRRPDRLLRRQTVELARAGAIPVTLAPRTVTVIALEQVKRLEPIVSRADLAAAAREVTVDGATVRGVVHNIGAADVAAVVVAVVDGRGATVARRVVGPLPAPRDLLPKRREFVMRLPGEPQRGWRLVVDPDDSVPEIYEGNNSVLLK